MKPITQQEIVDYVEANIQRFHERRLENLLKLQLMNVIKRKNPYLFKAKNINTASELEFLTSFCDADGNICWESIVKFNSGKSAES